MNKLSWFLYFADVAQSIGTLAVLFSAISCALFLVFGGMYLFHEDQVKYRRIKRAKAAGEELDYYDKDWNIGWMVIHKWQVWMIVGFFLVFITIGCVIPSRDTFYAIATSEGGEAMLKSSTGQKAERALDAWLDAQIAKSEAAKTKKDE